MVVARNLTLLRSHHLVADVRILKTLIEPDIELIKATATLKDGSKLHVSEAEGADWREYSYHWQKNDRLIRRWDNAPHHKNLPNFPHHVHNKRNVISGEDMNLADVLTYIEKHINE
ncbi:MAG: DUF6516 family protein [Methanobacteriota archaeon]